MAACASNRACILILVFCWHLGYFARLPLGVLKKKVSLKKFFGLNTEISSMLFWNVNSTLYDQMFSSFALRHSVLWSTKWFGILELRSCVLDVRSKEKTDWASYIVQELVTFHKSGQISIILLYFYIVSS